MNKPIIGIGGWMTSGKDALADILVRDHGYGKTFMSEALHEAVSKLHIHGGPWVRLSYPVRASGSLTTAEGTFMRYSELVDLVGYTEAKRHDDVRAYLQGLGTEVSRNMLGENTWVDVAARKIQKLREYGPVVITGIRYQNELDMLWDQGGIAVWIMRPGLEAPATSHTSETSLVESDFDLTVNNFGTLDDLAKLAILLHEHALAR